MSGRTLIVDGALNCERVDLTTHPGSPASAVSPSFAIYSGKLRHRSYMKTLARLARL
jgi:hypothetical protein